MELIIFSLIMLLVINNACFATNDINQNKYPPFSWDKVQVCIHLCNPDKDFNKKEIKFMSQFPLICIEKHQAVPQYGGMELGTLAAAKAIKEENKNNKILFYWNSRIDYGDFYTHGKITQQHPEWIMKDLNGNAVTVHDSRNTYDITNPAFREWWYSIPVKWCNNPYIDGIFVDAIPQYVVVPENKVKIYGEKKAQEIQQSVDLLLKEMYNRMGKDKLMIGNYLRGNKQLMSHMGTHFHNFTDGGMLEHFCEISGHNKEIIANDIELIKDAARRGKIIVVKGWPRYNFTNSKAYANKSPEEMEKIAKEDIVFPLACFLAGAGKYAYFCYSWGYKDKDGGLIDYPEYHKPLGKPLGESVRKGWVYTRSFEHADIRVDLENRKAEIKWK